MRSAAFLRGINVSGRRVTKDVLIAVFTELGLRSVDTFLASGNVLFANRRAAADTEHGGRDEAVGGATGTDQMEAALEAALGYPVPTTVRSYQELIALADHEPFPAGAVAASTGKPQVMLLFERPTAATRRAVLELATDDDLLAFGPRELHWLPSGGTQESELDLDRIGKLVGTTTMRTANTIRRLTARATEGGR